MRYTKSTALSGARPHAYEREPDEIVDEEYVRRYIGPDTLDFFRNLGGTEKVTKHRDGTIAVKSVRPDGKETRITVFTPIKEG